MGSLLIRAIVAQLNQYLNSVDGPPADASSDHAVLGNMAKSRIAGGEDSNIEDKIVVSLVNVSEESSLKNKPAFKRNDEQHYDSYPSAYVNLYLLFASNYGSYPTAIDNLIRVLEFFQGKKVFKFKNAPLSTANLEELDRSIDTEISIELHTLSFEQTNDLWGSLGGKQVPFLLYCARLLPVQAALTTGRSALISEIDLTTLS